MIDHHIHRDHRLEAARATGDRYATERSWCIVPEEPKPPMAVWLFVAGILAVGVIAFVTPIALRSVWP